MCFNFLTGRTGPSVGPTSSADKAAGYLVDMAGPRRAVNPMSAAQRATQNKQTADRNTVRRADSYGSSTTTKSTNSNIKKIAPAPVNVPGAEKIKQTFKQQTNNDRNAKRIADRMVVKAKRRLPVPSGTPSSYFQPVTNWKGTKKTILGA